MDFYVQQICLKQNLSLKKYYQRIQQTVQKLFTGINQGNICFPHKKVNPLIHYNFRINFRQILSKKQKQILSEF